MKNQRCCGTPRRASGLAGVLLSGIPLVFMPKCPLCVATYITLLTGISVSTATAGHLRSALIMLCTGFLCILALRMWRSRKIRS